MNRGFLFGLAGGVAAGILLGWLLFGGRTAPPRSPTAREVEGDAGKEVVAAPAPRREIETAEQIEPRPAPHGTRDEEATVPQLIARLDAARAARDPDAFRALLARLAETRTRAAQEKLVALMADPTLTFPGDPVGYDFFEWLRESDVPGIAAAARARVEREAAENPGEPTATAGWQAILALHGGVADLDWLEARAEHRPGGWSVLEAFARAGARPEVAERVEVIFRERRSGWFSGYLRAFAKENPATALRLVEEGLADPRPGEEAELARLYGDLVGREGLDDARALLLNLDRPEQRIGAVYALERMSRRGLDISGMESLLLAPVETLEGATRTSDSRSLYAAMFAIQRNPLTWSERAARALDVAAAAKSVTGAPFAETARRVRAGLRNPEGEWIER